MASADSTSSPGESPPDRQEELSQIGEALRNLRFGTITVIVQDGVVVQIDRTERRRLRLTNGK